MKELTPAEIIPSLRNLVTALDESARLAGVLGVKLAELVFGQAELPVTQELVRELEAVGTREEMAGLGKLLQLLLLGYQRAADART